MKRMLVVLMVVGALCHGLELKITDEFRRIDPFGAIVEVDGGPGDELVQNGTVLLEGAAGGYVSFNLGIMPDKGEEPVTVALNFENQSVEVDLYRAWFHLDAEAEVYYPGALIPLDEGSQLNCPALDNQIENQTAISLWVDIWVPADLTDQILKGTLSVVGGTKSESMPVALKTGINPIPVRDGLEADHNTYGVGWVFRLVPEYARTIEGFRESDEYNQVVHDVYRLLYEHRGRVHNLGFNHNGRGQAIFMPQLHGDGPDAKIVSWEYFDRRFGPLLDGSAFADTRRGPFPVPGIYLSITPEWPASLAYWGEPAYEETFVNIVSAMEKHFRAKGWVNSRFEMFFNHKKRYKAFSWDGDETKFTKDNVYFHMYGDWLRKSIPADSPVDFVFRHDASWQLYNQVMELKGVVDHWILSGGCSSLYPDVIPELRKRGDVIWVYGGPESIFKSSSAILKLACQAWMKGADGFEHWQFASPGKDPWFNCDGARTGLIFSGERFGIRGPIPCVRLKIQRNFLQDIALAKSLFGRDGSAARAAALAGLRPRDWYVAERPALLDKDPQEWNNPDIGEAAVVKASPEDLTADWALGLRKVLLSETIKARHQVGPELKWLEPTPEELLPPYVTPGIVKPNKKEAAAHLESLAKICMEKVDGGEAAQIMTEWGADKMFNVDPRDKWAGGDNFDVHHEKYDAMKKQLILLARTMPFETDCNLWVVCRNNPEKVQVLIRQFYGICPYYSWGQLYRDPTDEMKKCLEGGIVRADTKDYIVFFAPIKDEQGKVTGFVECATRAQYLADE